MNTPVSSPMAAPRLHAAYSWLRSYSLFAAQVTWVVVVLLTAALVVVVAPLEFARLQAVCTGAGCTDPHLTASTARALQGLGLSRTAYAVYFIAVELAVALGYAAVGALIFWRKSTDRLALLAAFFLVAYGGAMLAGPGTIREVAAHHSIWRWAMTCVDVIGIVSVGSFFCLFPGGRFVPRWTLALAVAWSVLLAPQYIAPASALNIETWPAPVQLPVWAALLGGIAVAQVYRYRHLSDSAQRRQTRWVVFGVATTLTLLLALIVLGTILPPRLQEGLVFYTFENTVWYLSMLLIPLSIGVAVLRYRLWNVDLIINRTLLYSALTSITVGLYVMVVGGLDALLRMRDNLLLSLLGAGLVAVLFQPLRIRLQHGVNHLMYGHRDDPYAVLSHLGRRLENTLSPEAVLPTIVDAVRQILKLPYAAITLREGNALVTGAASGTQTEHMLTLPLVYQHELVGQLVLSPRSGESSFSSSDLRLLDDLAWQAGIAGHAVRLKTELQHAREQLVTAREEERRRLRRDLHDGLGPQLGSQTLTLTAVRKLLRRDPDAAEALLDDAMLHAQQAITDIRRVVYDLRPPALDDLGLVGALREGAARYGHNGLQVTVEAPESLPPLPAAVEVACYRIVQEALTNVVRHAGARTCLIRLVLADSLLVEVRDDGQGLPAEHRTGVGITSMRERGAELGGSCVVESLSEGGTRVSARLPLPGRT